MKKGFCKEIKEKKDFYNRSLSLDTKVDAINVEFIFVIRYML